VGVAKIFFLSGLDFFQVLVGGDAVLRRQTRKRSLGEFSPLACPSCRGRQLGRDHTVEEAPADDKGDAADGRVVEARSVKAGVYAVGGGLV
jgi:hypothetical protein